MIGSRAAIENSLKVDEKLMVYPAPTQKMFNGFFTLSFFRSGVLILVLLYTVMGSILFVSLEGDLDEMDGIETAASKPYPRNNDMIYAELRTR